MRFLYGRTSSSPQTRLRPTIRYATRIYTWLYGRTFPIGVNVVKRFFNYQPLPPVTVVRHPSKISFSLSIYLPSLSLPISGLRFNKLGAIGAADIEPPVNRKCKCGMFFSADSISLMASTVFRHCVRVKSSKVVKTRGFTRAKSANGDFFLSCPARFNIVARVVVENLGFIAGRLHSLAQRTASCRAP